MSKTEKTLSVAAAAESLGISRNYLYQLHHLGKGPDAEKVNGRVLFTVAALNAWQKARLAKRNERAKAVKAKADAKMKAEKARAAAADAKAKAKTKAAESKAKPQKPQKPKGEGEPATGTPAIADAV